MPPPSPRVVLVGPFFPYRGGIAHFNNRLAQALAERCDVRMLSFDRQYPALLFPGTTQFEDTPWDLPGTPERLIDSVNPLSWKRAGDWLAAQRPDAVILAHWIPFFVPAYAAMLRRMQRVLAAEGAPRPEVTLFLHNVHPHKPFPLTEPLMRLLVGMADSYFTLSGHITDDLRALKPEARTLEAFHPVYDIFEDEVPPADARRRLGLPDRPTLLFFGVVRRYKGLDILIEALPKVRERVDVQLVVAGEFYDDEEAIKARIHALGLDAGPEPAVRFFPGYIPNEEVHLHFSAADLAVQPYRTATPSGVVQTAFYFGVPMVVSDLGVLAEMVPDGEAGYVVPPEDPDALAETIVRFFEADPAPLVEGAKAQGDRYSWDALVDELLPFVMRSETPPKPSM